MAQTYKTGLIITGDASGGIRAIKATDTELGKLNQGFDRGSRRSKQFNQDVNETSRGLDVLKASAGGVAAAMATAFGAGSIINQTRIIADTDSLAKSIGMATGNLQAWDYAAQQAGLAGGKMGDILKDITERIGEFTAEGTGEAAALFENLNLSIEEMKRLAPDQQLLRIADAISTLETRGEQISYLERLGSDATLLLPLLENNAAQLREFTNEAQELGVAMSQVDIENALEANRAMSQLTGTMEGFTNQVVADLGPGLATAVGGLTDFIQEAGGAASILEDVKDVATITAAIIAGRYAGAFAIATAAKLAATQQSIAYQMALARMAGVSGTAAASQTALAAASRGASAALLMVGGPVGAAILVTAALGTLANRLDKTAERAANMEFRANELAESLQHMGETSIRTQLAAVTLEMAKLEGAQEALEVQNRRSSRTNSVLAADFRNLQETMEVTAAAQSTTTEESDKLKTQQMALEKALELVSSGARGASDEISEFGGVSETAAAASREAAKETTTLANSYENLLDRITPNRAEARQYAQDLGRLNLALASGRINTVQYMQAMGLLQENFQAAQRDTTDLADASVAAAFTMEGAWDEVRLNGLRRLDDGIANMWQGAIDGSLDAGEAMKRIFTQTLAEMAHMAITRPIMVQFASSMGISGGAGGQQAGGAQSFGGMPSLSGMMNGSGAIANAYRAFQGTGSTYAGTFGSELAVQSSGGFRAGFNSFANSGVGNGLLGLGGGFVGSELGGSLFGESEAQQIGSAIGGAIGQVAIPIPGVGAAIGSFVGSGWGSLADNVFGLSEETPFSGRFGTTGTNDPSQYASSGKDGVFEHQDSGANFYGQSALGYTGFLDRGTERLQRAGRGEDKGWAEELANASVKMDNLVASIADSPEELEAMRAAVQGLETSSSNAGQIIEFALNERPRAALEALGGHFGEFVRGLEGGIESVVQQAQVAQQAHSVLSGSMERLNLQFDASSAGAYEAASSIAARVGGPESLSNLFSGFYDSFYTEEEKFDNLAADLSSTFADMGRELPTTREGVRELVEGLQLMGAAGQEQLATVLQLNQPLSQYIARMEEQRAAAVEAGEAVDDSAESMRALADIARERSGLERELLQLQGNTEELRRRELAGIDESNRALQERIWSIQDERAAAQEATAAYQQAISGVESAFQAVERAVNAERQILENAYSATTDSINANIATVQQAMQESAAVASTLSNSLDGLLSARRRESMASRREAQGYLQSTFASGGLGDADELERALGAVSEPSEGLFSSFTDYQRDFYQTANVIAALEERAEEQVSTEEQSLRALENQLQSAARQHEREMESLDSMLLQQQLQIENELGQMAWLESINGGVLGVGEAISGLQSAISSAISSAAASASAAAAASSAPSGGSGSSGGSNSYRVVDNGSSATYYTPGGGSHTVQGANAADLLRETYAQKLNGSHANGLWSVPFDGYRAELHNGEAVLPAPAAAAFRDFATGGKADNSMLQAFNTLIRHVASLEQEVKELKSINKGTASHTSKLAGAMDRMRREQEATT